MSSLDFGETAASLTFHDPDDPEIIGIDTQADDFRFNFTLPSQGFSLTDHEQEKITEHNIKMVERLTLVDEGNDLQFEDDEDEESKVNSEFILSLFLSHFGLF